MVQCAFSTNVVFLSVFLSVGQKSDVGFQWILRGHSPLMLSFCLSLCQLDKKVMSATNGYFEAILNSLIEVTTKELTKYERTKFETLITIHVHQRDIFNDLVRKICHVVSRHYMSFYVMSCLTRWEMCRAVFVMSCHLWRFGKKLRHVNSYHFLKDDMSFIVIS